MATCTKKSLGKNLSKISKDSRELLECVIGVANIVRMAAEELVDEGDGGWASDSDLEGACGDISWVLAGVLLRKPQWYVEGSWFNETGHCWVEVPLSEGFSVAVDVTATQFAGVKDKVFVTRLPSVKYVEEDRGIRARRLSKKDWHDNAWQRRLKKRVDEIIRAGK